MIFESILLGYIFFFGANTLGFLDRYHKNLSLMLAIPFSLVSWSLFYIVYRFTFIDESVFSFTDNHTPLITFFSLSFILLAYRFYVAFHRYDIAIKGFYAIAVFVASYAAVLLDMPIILSQDSYYLVDIFYDYGKTLADGYPPFITSIQVLCSWCSVDYFMTSYVYLISFNFYFFIGYFIHFFISKTSLDSKLKLFIAVLAPLMLLTSFMGFYNFFYINHHLFVSFMFLIALFLLYIYRDSSDTRVLWLGVFFVSATVTMRMEVALFSYLFLIMIYSLDFVDRKLFLKLLLFFVIVASAWQGWLIYILPDEAFVDPWHYMVIVAAMILSYVVIAVIALFEAKSFSYLYRNIRIFALIALVSILCVAFVVAPAHMSESVLNFFTNTFYERQGGWGVFWFFVVVACSYILLDRGYKPKNIEIFYFFISAIVLLLVLSYFRTPYRLGVGDSANRILFHFAPMILIWCVVEVVKKIDKGIRKS